MARGKCSYHFLIDVLNIIHNSELMIKLKLKLLNGWLIKQHITSNVKSPPPLLTVHVQLYVLRDGHTYAVLRRTRVPAWGKEGEGQERSVGRACGRTTKCKIKLLSEVIA